ncbi:MAG: tellurite resistance/C4-dicarboxylate transporter family protein [Beijerinckiaceae bacterium]
MHSRPTERHNFNLLRAVLAWTDREVSDLDAGCFAIVMATGITSNAMFAEGQRVLSDVLFRVNLFVYPWLILATIIRATGSRAALWSDLANPRLVYSFFTFVAASDVLGVQIALRGFATIPLLLWLLAFATFVVLSYFSSGLLIFRNAAGGADLVVHGGELLAIVGAQSLVLLGVHVAATAGEPGNAIFVLLHALWGIGLVLYGIFIAHFAYRISYMPVRPQDLTPALWVVMGAAAISANAGCLLVQYGPRPDFLHAMRPFVDGASFTIWAWGTWWIPLLVMFGIWKHGARRIPLTYTPMLWSIVFPLGMYAVATDRLSLADDYPPMRVLSHAVAWVALGAWIATMVSLIVASARSLRKFARSTVINQASESG